jgi:hypothetical protein
MSKINYFSQNALDMMSSENNMTQFYEQMKAHPDDTSWLKEFFGFEPMVPTNYELDFSFKMDTANPEDSDYDNAVALYEAFNKLGIPPVVIFNEKFLVGFIFTFGYKYFVWRWKLDSETKVSAHIFFPASVRRSVAGNAVGRLYQRVLLTVDPDKPDDYSLTKFAFENQATLNTIGWHNYIDGKTAHLAYFKAFKQWSEETGKSITGHFTEEVAKHLSLLCNINIVENMDEQDVIEYLLSFMRKNNPTVEHQ